MPDDPAAIITVTVGRIVVHLRADTDQGRRIAEAALEVLSDTERDGATPDG